jgi:DNA-binding SARP family transcriptional activator
MEFLILGSLEVRGNTGAVDLGGERQRKLLAILLLNANNIVPVERLVDELWSNPPTTARRQVYNGMAALRRRLVDAGATATIVVTVAGGYRIQLGDAVLDAHVARRHMAEADRATADGRHDDAIRLLTSAAALWRGSTLAGLSTPLIDGAAARLDEQRIAVVEELAELRLAAGEGASLVTDLKEYVARYPLRESLRGTMMLALYRSGRQAEALAAFDEARHRLAEDLGLDPGPELRRIHATVLRGAGRATSPDEDDPVPAAASRPLSYLPAPLVDFVGRDAGVASVLRAIEMAAEQDRSAVVVIDGMGGVGKTSFAIHLAHRLAPRYPDGQYFVDLLGFTAHQRPVTPAAALESLMRQAGLPSSLTSSDIRADAAWLRAALAGRRILMVLDDVADSSFVEELLPGASGSLVLVTSRRQLVTLPGAHPVSLRTLPPHDALRLFASACGHNRAVEEPEASEQVVRLCGYLPLAVRAAGSRLRHRPLWSVADLVEQLRHPTQRLRLLGPHERSVADVLLVSYGRLSKAHQRLFRGLGKHAGPYVSARACAALANVPFTAAEQGLEALADCSLVTPYDRNRYEFHPLLRDLAVELALHHEGDVAATAAAVAS